MSIEKLYKKYLRTRKRIDIIPLTKQIMGELGQSENFVIIVPFRDQLLQNRLGQLNKFVDHYINLFKEIKYNILIVEQSDDSRKFNRGMLLNIGFIMMHNKCSHFIFHDVDLLSDKNMVKYYLTNPKLPIHIASSWKEKYNYPSFIGGIISFNKEKYIKINGFPNNFWGWGGEDDALYNRLAINNIDIYKTFDGHIREIRHKDTKTIKKLINMKRWENVLDDLKNWKNNGLTQLSKNNIKIINSVNINKNVNKITVELN